MFRGTYTSEFYRAIRDLLHDQVSLHRLAAQATRGAYRAQRSLERRWQELLSQELQYRT
jgi:anaerobic magnesium-protoporphyrin IX monomethyl ester cyclase